MADAEGSQRGAKAARDVAEAAIPVAAALVPHVGGVIAPIASMLDNLGTKRQVRMIRQTLNALRLDVADLVRRMENHAQNL